jgi:tRNA1(Val) A37 N6-methylase TrmN6
VALAQPVDGFRYGAEAFWLYGFVAENLPASSSILDLGCGSGILAALFLAAGHRTVGIDVRPEWEEGWELSRTATAGYSLDLRRGDVRTLDLGTSFDRVVANPPFFRLSAGPVPKDPWRAAARSESEGTLVQFVRAAGRHLAPAGRVAMVVPVERAQDLDVAAQRVDLRRLRSAQVGRKRWLAEYGHEGTELPSAMLSESDPRVSGWYPAR